jgi:hypothetical protein
VKRLRKAEGKNKERERERGELLGQDTGKMGKALENNFFF